MNRYHERRQRLPQTRKRKPGRYIMTRLLVAVGVFALTGNIPIYSITHPSPAIEPLVIDTPIDSPGHKAYENSVALNLPVAVETYVGYETEPLPSTKIGKWYLHTIADGETLDSILQPLSLTTNTQELLKHPDVKKELATLKAGKKLLVQVHNQRIEQLIYATGRHKAFITVRQNSGYSGKWDESFEEQSKQVAFIIRNPLHEDAAKAGLPSSITRQLVKIFKNDVNFRRIRVGDQVGVIFEGYYYQSERIYTGAILAAEFIHRGETHQRVRLLADREKPLYLKPDNSLEIKKVAFNRYPLKGGRLSSGFGMRDHPVLRKRRQHSGVDIAAPRNTPIYATGDGKVRFAGYKGSYGNTVEISHGDGIRTRYSHMSKHTKDLRIGATVKKGDIIGYVGSTGRSTGNHVHYEFLKNGKPQNPQQVKLPMKGVLSAGKMKEFKWLVKRMSNRLLKLRDNAAIDRDVGRQFGG